jgi:hypothetical protein
MARDSDDAPLAAAADGDGEAFAAFTGVTGIW